MSTATTAENTSNKLVTNYDSSKIFLGDNNYITADYTNDGYDDVTLAAGTVMGRVAATDKVIPLESDASDGSQYPVGILAEAATVEAGADAVLSLCNYGDVEESQLVLEKVGDTLATVISGKTLRDRIAADTAGVRLQLATEMTGEDNQ